MILVDCSYKYMILIYCKFVISYRLIGTMTKNEKDRVRFRNQNSGAYNRRVKQRHDAMTQSLAGSISKLFNAKSQKSLASSQAEEPMNEGVDFEEVSSGEASGEDSQASKNHEKPMNEGVGSGDDNVASEDHESILDLEKDVDINYDPGLWGVLMILRG